MTFLFYDLFVLYTYFSYLFYNVINVQRYTEKKYKRGKETDIAHGHPFKKPQKLKSNQYVPDLKKLKCNL